MIGDDERQLEGTGISALGTLSEAAASASIAALDCSVANSARVYDYWLGGKDNFGVDREVGAAVAALAPWIVPGVRANRAFLRRVVHCVADQGVSQFLDIGAGLPTRPNVHQVAQARDPQARVVYLDNDPVVLAHARALLARDARTMVAAGDARDPAGILADPVVIGHLDWSRPVCVLLGALPHFLTDTDDPAGTVAALRAAMVPGSFLVISHCTPGAGRAQAAAVSQAVRLYQEQAAPFTPPRPAPDRGLAARPGPGHAGTGGRGPLASQTPAAGPADADAGRARPSPGRPTQPGADRDPGYRWPGGSVPPDGARRSGPVAPAGAPGCSGWLPGDRAGLALVGPAAWEGRRWSCPPRLRRAAVGQDPPRRRHRRYR